MTPLAIQAHIEQGEAIVARIDEIILNAKGGVVEAHRLGDAENVWFFKAIQKKQERAKAETLRTLEMWRAKLK